MSDEPEDRDDAPEEEEESVDTGVIQRFDDFYSEVYDTEIRDRVEFFKNNASEDYLSIPIDFELLYDFDDGLARGLTKKPDTFYSAAKRALEMYDDIEELQEAELLIANHESHEHNIIEIRDIRAKDVNKLITIEGIIKKATQVLPKVDIGAYRCLDCKNIHRKKQPTKYPEEPDECSCGASKWKLEYRQSKIVDYQKLTIQEAPEGLKGGETPQSEEVYITGGLTGEVTPGERVTVTGILRADVEPNDDSIIFDTYMEGKQVGREEQEFDEVEISDEDVEAIIKLSQRDDIYEYIQNSIAPQLYGYNNLREATVYQLFSGVAKENEGSYKRGDIHMLYIGDPGTGKSELLQYVKRISPRGVYAVGQGASKAGLTATAVKESDMTGDQKWSLEAGALVLADKGVACIDEVDKMGSDDRSGLHEALEQQQVSVAKAGINATLKSRCSMLAAANPKYGRFDEYEPISEQIDLEPSLVSRFDLIFRITDKPSEDKDRRLADHVISSHQMMGDSDEEDVYDDIISADMLQKYIAYARKNCQPIVTNEVKKELEDFYVELRNKHDSDAVPITARALEALIRITEASAKVQLRDEATAEDAQRAIGIMKTSLEEVSMDPDTGEIDSDKIETSTPSSQRNRIRFVKDLIEELEEEYEDDEGVPIEELIERAEEEGFNSDRVEEDITKLSRRGDVIQPTNKTVRTL